MKKTKRIYLLLVMACCLLLSGCVEIVDGPGMEREPSFDLTSIPEYSGEPYVLINDNVPEFDEADMTTESYELYGPLDYLGRCTLVEACVGQDLMPTEKRGSISHIKPTGWQIAKYDFVDGKYLYNRCHLIGFQLTGENDNELNLITGTRYMNVEGMLPFEDFVADYVKETGNHVLYRVTPIFEDENLVASGVQMEAMSVEDNGRDVMFNVYCYNVQPGVLIDYETGENYLGEDLDVAPGGDQIEAKYVLNTKSQKFHKPDCGGLKNMNPENKPAMLDMNKISAYLAENCNQNILLSDLAEMCSMSISTMLRHFHKTFGTTPIDYLKNIRLDRATALLMSTDLRVSEIADQCGFSSSSYFISVFRKKFGKTPEEFRKS